METATGNPKLDRSDEALRLALDRLNNRPTISVRDAAVITAQSEFVIRAAVREGTLPTIQFGRNIRIVSAHVRELLGL